METPDTPPAAEARSSDRPVLEFMVLAAIAGMALALVWSMGDVGSNLPILVPLTTLGAVGVLLFGVFRLRLRVRNPVFDIGFLYCSVVILYGIFPLMEYLAIGGDYTIRHENRLWIGSPDPSTMGALAWYYVAHLGVFAVTYLAVRSRRGASLPARKWDGTIPVAAAILSLAILAFFAVLGRFYDLSFSSYLESYLVLKRLPLLLRQIAVNLRGVGFVLKLVVIAALFQRFRRYQVLIAVWLGVVAISAFVQLGSRTELMLTGLAVLLMYHTRVRKLSFGVVALMGTTALLLFAVLGAARAGARGTETLGFFSYSNEFSAIFANVYDLGVRRASGQIPSLDWRFSFADLVALVPRQLLPFERINQADWYVNLFFESFGRQGGGLAFGTLAESVVGGGWPDLVLRASLLGALTGLIQRLFTSRGDRFWVFLFYVWAYVLMFELFRGSTLYNLVPFVYQFLPAAFGCAGLAAVLRLLRDGARGKRFAQTAA